jgi:hypothetical protein
MKSPPVLHVALSSSRCAALLVSGACVSTAALLAWLPLPFVLRCVGVIAVGGYAVWLLRRWAIRSSRRAIAHMEIGIDHRVALIDVEGKRVEGDVCVDSYVSAVLTTIVVRTSDSRFARTIAILPDMLPTDDFRQLRVLLRFGQKPRIDG